MARGYIEVRLIDSPAFQAPVGQMDRVIQGLHTIFEGRGHMAPCPAHLKTGPCDDAVCGLHEELDRVWSGEPPHNEQTGS